jgi:outer membrane biosynthesis protein TonB
MWLWQQRNLLKLRLVFWSRVLLVSALMHITLLFLMLFVYKGDNFSYHFSVDRQAIHEANIVFLPLQKHAPQHERSTKTAASETKALKTVNQFEKREEVVKEVKPGTRVVAAAQPKKISVKKKQVKKAVKQIETVEKKVEHKVEQLPQETVEKERVAKKESDDALYLGRADLDALQIQDAITQEILTHWRPPAGLAKSISCQIKVQLAFNGTVGSVAVQQSSKVAIFDMSARTAAGKMKLPKWAWGKELIISFNQ